MQEQLIFIAALEKEDPAERAAFLDRACVGNPVLRQRIERLLHRDRQTGTFLDHPAVVVGNTVDERMSERPGTVIGPYQLLEQIGEGGFGLVFLGEQQHPIRRQVAIKVLKPGMDTCQVIARFEAERQALALMDHPNIARVFDAGATESGRPYFVMELVRGVPVTDYCEQNRVALRPRLDLFISICQAVQHAHQKGIIHRDLKPNNVLVTSQDGAPAVKVIDFGIAKATGPRLTDRTLVTNAAQMMGTPLYMSPEQVGMDGVDVDTRSDIYSLGVILYELLTGATPLDRDRLRQVSYDELRRIIRDEEPPRPSERLAKDEGRRMKAESKPIRRAAWHRRVPFSSFLLPPASFQELDWIAMKALEKDRNRRYETTSALALDVERYLHEEPVQAGPPGRTYRLKKLLRRNRGPVLAAGLVVLCLIAGIVGTTWGMFRADEARRAEATRAETEAAESRRATRAEEQARADAARARQEEEKARRSDAQARAVLAFFQDRILAAGRPKGTEGGLGKDVTLRQALDAAEPEIDRAFAGQPVAEAAIRDTLATSYWLLGESDLAIRHQERALALRRRALGPTHADTLTTLDNLANACISAGRLEDAKRFHEEALQGRRATLGSDDIETLKSVHNLGCVYLDMGRTDEAIRLLEEGSRGTRARLGPDDPNTLAALGNVVRAYLAAGRAADALPLAQEVFDRARAKLGPDHAWTLLAGTRVAIVRRDLGRLDVDTIALLEEVWERSRNTLGLDHQITLGIGRELAVCYHQLGRSTKAIAQLEEVVKRSRAKRGGDHPETLKALCALGAVQEDVGNVVGAEALDRELVLGRRRRLGGEHPDTGMALAQLGQVLVKRARPVEAEPLLRESLGIGEKMHPDSWQRFQVMSLLGASLLGQKKYAAAEPLLLGGYAGLEERAARLPAPARNCRREARERLVQLYQAWGKPDRAAQWRAERSGAGDVR